MHESNFQRASNLRRFKLGVLNLQHSSSGKKHPDKRGHGVGPLPLRRNHQIDQQNAQRKHREHEDGKGQQIIRAGEVLWRRHLFRPLGKVGSDRNCDGSRVRCDRGWTREALTGPLMPG